MTGFTSNEISIFDITNPLAPAQVVGGEISTSGSPYTIRIERNITGTRRYLAVTPSAWIPSPTPIV